MAEISSDYLKRLKFDRKLLESIHAKFITNMRLVVLLLITITILGIVSYLTLPRRLNPELKIPIIIVSTVLPGAGPEDIETLITIPLENQVRGLSGITEMNSVSSDNFSSITLQFASNISAEKAKDDVQAQVDLVTSLPKDALTPRVAAIDFENQPIWTFVLAATDNDLPSLMRFSDELKRKIEDDTKVDRVAITGFEEQEIVVEVSPESIKQYNLNPAVLSAAVKAATASFPAGTISSTRNTFTLTVDPSITSVETVRALRISVDNQSIALGDIATVSERSKQSQHTSLFASSEAPASRVVVMNVYKTSSAKIDEAEKGVATLVEREVSRFNGKFKVTTVLNTAEQINTQFTDLLGEFKSTIILVFVCLLLFLGLRQAVISAFTVPLTFLSAFFFMSMVGMSINFLSLFAFLLALGLLIDDTIVVVSAMTTYYKSGKFTPTETGLIVWRDTIVPIWSTTITTIWSFVPLLLSSGIIGEFIKPIPVVIAVTMISSTAIAVLITLPFMMVLLKPQIPRRLKILGAIIGVIATLAVVASVAKGNPLLPLILILSLIAMIVLRLTALPMWNRIQQKIQENKKAAAFAAKAHYMVSHGVISTEKLSSSYYRLMMRILNSPSARRWVVILIVIYAVGAFMLLPLGFVQNEFFPKADNPEIFINLRLPAGTTVETTTAEARRLLEEVRNTPESDFAIAQVGQTVSGGFGGGGGGENTATITIHLPDEKERTKSSIEIAENLRKQFKNYNGGEVTVVEESGGPPAGADVSLTILGDDLAQLTRIGDTLQSFLKEQAGITNVDSSIKPGTSALVFVPDYQKLSENKLGVESIGLWLRTYASGFTLDSVNFENSTAKEKDIVVKFGSSKPTVAELSSIQIPTPTGSYVPLESLGKIILKPNPTLINRDDSKRALTISASVIKGYNATQKNADLLKYANTLELPEGYSFKTGGANEENQKSVQSILQAMLVAFILILITMVIQFGSYRQAIIVLMVIPLAVSSVFVSFALTGTPLSFPALIGVLSLFGIVVTNSMFIVDKINLNRKEGMKFKESIADAGASRMEPIILTKLATVLGLLPITLADPLWRGLGGAIISGLLIASSIMLLFIPVVYYSWFKGEEK